MPGLDYIKRYQTGGDVTTTTEEETAERPIPVAKAPVSKGPYALPTPVGKTAVDEGILQRMQELINEREARKGGFNEAMLDAQAWWSGGQAGPYKALTERRAQKEADEATTFQMRRDLAQQRMAQERAKARMVDVLGPQGGTPGAETGAAAAPPGSGAILFGVSPTQSKYLIDLVRDPATRQVVIDQAKDDPDAAAATVRAYVAKNSGDTELVKDLRYGMDNGLITQDAARNIFQLRVAGGPEAFKPIPFTGVVGGKPGTYERQPLAAAAQLGGPAATPAAPAQRPPVPGMGAPQAAPSAPTATVPTPAARPTMAGPAAAAPSAPAAAPAAPIAAPTTPQMPPAQAPRPVVPAPVASGISKEDLAIYQDVESTRGKERAKESEVERKAFKASVSTDDVIDRKVVSDRIAKLVKDNPKIAGVISDPTFFNGLAQLVKTGVSTPRGPIGLEAIEEFVFNSLPSTDFPDKAERRELASYLARFELMNSQMIKGQGQVSNAERQIIRDASVSISDPAEVIYKRAKMVARRAELDSQLSDIYGAKEYTNFEDFKRDPAYKAAFKQYENDLRNIVNEKVVLTKANIKANQVRQRKAAQQMPQDIADIVNKYTVPQQTGNK